MKDITSGSNTNSITSMVSTVSGGMSHDCQQIGSRNRRKANLSTVYSEVVLCVMVSCLLVGVCSAACNNSTADGQPAFNCSVSHDLSSETQANSDQVPAQKVKVPSNSSADRSGHASSDITAGYDSTSSTISDLQPNSSQEVLVVSPGSKSDDNTKTNSYISTDEKKKMLAVKESLTGTDPESSKTEESDSINIVAIVIPFVSVILAAITFCIIYKLCRRYQCCKNEECLKKCSAFCDNCMTTPFVYQAPGGKGSNDQVSYTSDTTHVSHHSANSHLSRPSAIVRQPNGVSRGVSQRPVDHHRLSWRSNASPNASNHDLSRSPSHHHHHPAAARQDSSRSSHSTAALLAHQNPRQVARSDSGRHGARRHDSGRVTKQGSASKARHDSGASRSSQDSAQELLSPKGHH